MRVFSKRHLRAAVRAPIALALAHLSHHDLSDQHIHAARKCIKKARAALRLLRDCLAAATYDQENEALRDAARPLSAVRDSRILLDTFDVLVDKSTIDRDATAALRRALVNERAKRRRRAVSPKGAAPSRRMLRSVQERVSQWPLRKTDPELIADALQRVYRRGRRAMEKARTSPNSENLHEWRKQVKYLWHQLQLLEPLHSSEIRKRAEQLHELSDHLGNEHDLFVLRDKVRARLGILSRSAARTLLRNIERRRAVSRRKALAMGRSLFCDRPSQFVERFSGLEAS